MSPRRACTAARYCVSIGANRRPTGRSCSLSPSSRPCVMTCCRASAHCFTPLPWANARPSPGSAPTICRNLVRNVVDPLCSSTSFMPAAFLARRSGPVWFARSALGGGRVPAASRCSPARVAVGAAPPFVAIVAALRWSHRVTWSLKTFVRCGPAVPATGAGTEPLRLAAAPRHIPASTPCALASLLQARLGQFAYAAPRGHAPIRRRREPHRPVAPHASPRRSEEHTSELQSPCNLVCRLLL